MSSTDQLRWRTPPEFRAAPWRVPKRLRRRLALGATLLALVGAVAGLASWWRARPHPLFIPLWITEYPSPLGDNWPARQDRRALLAGQYFSHPLLTSPGIDQRLLRRTLSELPGRRQHIVVYLSAYALTNDEGRVELLAAGVRPEDTGGRLPLTEVLKAIKDSPADGKLLILDIFWSIASPASGVMTNDAAARVQAELAAVPDPSRIVITSCGPGEIASASAALGRSVFGYYMELGLRGYADTASPTRDGRVTAHELGRFVQARVARWARENCLRSQTPQLLDEGRDFDLTLVPHGVPAPLEPMPPAIQYPAELAAAWRLRDAWASGNLLELTELTHRLERLLLAEEGRLSFGGTASDTAVNVTAIVNSLQAARAKLTAGLNAPPPRTLFESAQMGMPLDAALFAQVRQAAAQWSQTASQPPDKRAAAETALLQSFAAQHAKTPPAALALAVFLAAANDPALSPASCRFYDGLLKTSAPQPKFFETLLLRRLAELPATDPTHADSALRPLLQATLRLGACSVRPRTYSSCEPLLGAAAQAQYEGTYLYLAAGFAPRGAAEQQLNRANDRLDEIRELQQIMDEAFQSSDRALYALPGWTRLLARRPEWLATWLGTVEAADETLSALHPPAAGAGAMARSAAGERAARATMALSLQRQLLNQPLSPEALGQLSARLAAPDLVLDDLSLAEELLESPLLSADARAQLWPIQRQAAQRLAAVTLTADRADERQLIVPTDAPAGDSGAALHAEQEAATRRRQMAQALFQLAGLASGKTPVGRPSEKPQTIDVAPQLLAALAAAAPSVSAETARVAAVLSGIERSPDTAPEQYPGYRWWRAALRQQWAWRARRFWYAEADRQEPAFSGEAAREYARAAEIALEPVGIEFMGNDEVAGLTLESPSVPVVVPWRFAASSDQHAPRCQVLAPCDALESSAPRGGSGGSPFAFDLQLALGRLSDLSDVRGVLVQVRSGEQTYHQPLVIEGLERLEHFHVALSTNPRTPEPALDDVRVRPTGQDQAFYFFVTNPRHVPRDVLVELQAGSLYTGKLTLPPRTTVPVQLAGLPKPEQSLLPATELLLTVRDPETQRLLGQRRVAIEIALPREYVAVAGAVYQPGPVDVNKLSVRVAGLRALLPPAKVDLSLPTTRIPGFAGASGGAFRAVVAGATPIELTATGLRLTPTVDDNGYFYINVDECPRAFVFAATFAPRGQPTTPTEELRPAVRIDAPSAALAASNFTFGVETDNAPGGATLDLAICQGQGSLLAVERSLSLPTPRDRQSLVSPSGPQGAVLVRATLHDWRPTLDASGLVGHRYLRARLLSDQGQELASAIQPITFDDQPPQGLQFVQAGPSSTPGAKVTVSAACWPGLTAVTEAKFFLGAPVDGKPPAGAPPIEGKPVGPGGTQWTAIITLPEKQTGPQPVAVQFTNQVGLSSLATATIEVREPPDLSVGRIAGVVNEGPLPQAGLQVQLTDHEGKNPLTTQTSPQGTFVFDKLKPGEYKLSTSKSASDRKASATATVVGGQTAQATLELSLQ